MNKDIKLKLNNYIYSEYLKDNKALIYINLNKLNIYNSLSMKNQKELNSLIFEYIDYKSKIIPLNICLKIIFYTKNINLKNQKQIKYLIKEHYLNSLYDMQIQLSKNKLRILSLSIIAIISIFIYLVFYFKYNKKLFIEILGFICTFAIWEATDLYLNQRLKLKKNIKFVQRNIHQEVVFASMRKNDVKYDK